ncbi:hypothetical protein ACQ9BO_07645 [Flavobacterium sp. P21]|uniref:hypothetical protein n=1 Tax=Flavobacterium sp. P21 TaxID=3423948 RepID=UPI003D667636
MDYKNVLQQIQEIQLETFCTLDRFLSEGTVLLPRHRRGLYWLWSRLDYDLLSLARDNHKSEVPIIKLIAQRSKLSYISTVEHNGFKIIYNGIGGYKSNPPAFGLRERILQELNCMDHRTGTLNILKRFDNQEDWAISFFDFDDNNNKAIFGFLYEEDAYSKYASDIEKLWRLEFGHPILCRN